MRLHFNRRAFTLQQACVYTLPQVQYNAKQTTSWRHSQLEIVYRKIQISGIGIFVSQSISKTSDFKKTVTTENQIRKNYDNFGKGVVISLKWISWEIFCGRIQWLGAIWLVTNIRKYWSIFLFSPQAMCVIWINRKLAELGKYVL